MLNIKIKFIPLFILVMSVIKLSIIPVVGQRVQLEYIGIGYNFSYAPLSRVNEFIDLYNAAKTKMNGSIIETEMSHIHTLTGIHLTTALSIDKFIFDLSWTRRSKEVFANYEYPSHDERHIKYRTGTLTFGVLAPIFDKNQFSISAGMGVNFVSGKLQTYILSSSPTMEFSELNSFGNFGFEPVIQFYYRPFPEIPLKFGCRSYWQVNFANNDMSGLEKEMYNHWEKDISELKSGGSNLGVIFQALIIIPNFKIKMPEKKEKVYEEKKPTNPQKIKFTASILDSITKRPINAVVTITNKQGIIQSITSKSGLATTELFNNDIYTISIEAFGYQQKTDLIKLEDYPLESISRNYVLSMIKVGSSVTLKNIYFEKASAILMNESMTELNKILQFMNDNPLMAIELSGHTSSEGKDDYNLQLSTDRANAIKQWLTSKGIMEQRITTIGYGKTKPVGDNNTEEGRKMNRRVELKIIKNEQ